MRTRPLATLATAGLILFPLIAGCSDQSAPTEPSLRRHRPHDTVTATTSLSAACAGIPYSRLVRVGTASQLTNALSYARPGDLILLADGTYGGVFHARAAGTASARITVCGSRQAVIHHSTLSSGVTYSIQAAYNTLKGVTVSGGIQGVSVYGANYAVVDSVSVHDVGQEGIAVRKFSKGVKILRTVVRNTGRYNPKYGTGLYLGTDHTQWCSWTNCQMDVIDSIEVAHDSIGPGVVQTVVTLKEGTRNGYIHDNVFDGRSQNTSYGLVYAIVNQKGDRHRLVRNVLQNGPRHGFADYQLYPNTGNNNYFSANTISHVGGYGIYISSQTSGNVVKCDNQVSYASSGRWNVACQ